MINPIFSYILPMKKTLLFLIPFLLTSCTQNSSAVSISSSIESTIVPNPLLLAGVPKIFEFKNNIYELSFDTNITNVPDDVVLKAVIYDPTKITQDEFDRIKNYDLFPSKNAYYIFSEPHHIISLYSEKDDINFLYFEHGTQVIYKLIDNKG